LLEIVVLDDYAALSREAARRMAALIRATPALAIVAATGDTPMLAYQELARLRTQAGELDTTRLRVFQLDEYLGLSAADRRSLYGWLLRSLVEPLGVPAGQVVRLPGDAPDPAAAAREYDRAVAAAGGFDLAVLGLGPNGHLGFNEPPTAAGSPSRVVQLTEASLESNARYWGGREQVPEQALTAGLGQLLGSRQIMLLVSGAHKHDILHRSVAGPMTPGVPASFLQNAPQTIVLADRAAWFGER
jgi:glucosamine-6-phosphate deaminase